MATRPRRIGPQNAEELDDALTRPNDRSIAAAMDLAGDIVILGAGGKMGPSLALLANRSIEAAGVDYRVICVSRFSNRDTKSLLENAGVETIACDLLDRDALRRLPEAPNVLFMAGLKFGSSSSPSHAWALNTYLPGLIGERYRDARIVAWSTGNVYPFVSIETGGATEECAPSPIGEYAQSCLGRERILEFMSERFTTPLTVLRLNYATDLRYGVLVDIARAVASGTSVSLDAGYANTVWQGDANVISMQAFSLCSVPPAFLNVTGPEMFSVREVANRFASLLGTGPPRFAGSEPTTALLSNASKCLGLFGPLTATLDDLIEWTAQWVASGAPTLGKSTRFEVRDGSY